MSLPFLVEIGVEEIPDWMIPPALEELKSAFARLLDEHRLGGQVSWVDATPRRLVLRADGLLDAQAGQVQEITGPPVAAGAGAARGFAGKQGVTVEELTTLTTAKGEYYAWRRSVAGRETAAVLAETLPAMILGIPWPKTMCWTGKGGPRFIRPIRWVVALLGQTPGQKPDQKIVPFEVCGVRAGGSSSGHRRLGAVRIPVTIDGYRDRLRENFVLVAAAERRERIESGIAALLAGTGLGVRPDAGLLETLVYLTEYPTPILGRFDESYLGLPEEVLTTVMRHHQKYFSVVSGDGRLAPHFLAVMNAAGDPEGLVRRGNERVLRARFNDARFFWEKDQEKKLAERVEDLAKVTFQAKLGSYLEKTRRVEELAFALSDGCLATRRAARLAKCDLTTEMVKEFTELQGIVGGLYARAQGEPAEVARAIYEHYKPVSMEDAIPSTPEGRMVSLADKLDSLRECFRVGLAPSGSRDPLALRRAAQGVVRILVEGRIALPVRALLAGDATLEEFLLDRVKHYFRDVRRFRYDEVNAVVAAGWDDLADVERRLEAIQLVRPTPDFEPLAASFKRIRNILRQAAFAGTADVDAALLEAGPEADLHAEACRVRTEAERHRQARDYWPALEAIASLRPGVDLFFDKVLVNAPDARVRRNRLALLDGLLAQFSSIADFSEIVTGS